MRMLARSLTLAAALSLVSVFAAAQQAKPGTEEDIAAILARQTQEMLDAVSSGDASVWDRYLAPDAVYTDESGNVTGKADLVKEIAPFPKNISGKLKVADFAVHEHGSTAIATYVSVETEEYFGQTLHARYRETDTWIATPDGWRLVAAQLMALRDDPPAATVPSSRLDEYVGTYRLTPEVTYTIRRDGDHLVAQRSGRTAERLENESGDVFFIPGKNRLRTIFQRGADGKVTGFVERRETWDVRWIRLP
jgi:ketosteroid isomerase-like protein